MPRKSARPPRKGARAQAAPRRSRPSRVPRDHTQAPTRTRPRPLRVGGAVQTMPVNPSTNAVLVDLMRTIPVTAFNNGAESPGPLVTGTPPVGAPLALGPSAFPLDPKYAAIYRRRKLMSAEVEYLPVANLRHDGQLQIYLDFHSVPTESVPTFLDLMSSTSRQIVRGPVSGDSSRIDLKSRLDSALHQEVDTTEALFSRLGSLQLVTSVVGYTGDGAPTERSIIGYLRVRFRVRYTDPLMAIPTTGMSEAVPTWRTPEEMRAQCRVILAQLRLLGVQNALDGVPEEGGAASAAPGPATRHEGVPDIEDLDTARLVTGRKGTEPNPL